MLDCRSWPTHQTNQQVWQGASARETRRMGEVLFETGTLCALQETLFSQIEEITDRQRGPSWSERQRRWRFWWFFFGDRVCRVWRCQSCLQWRGRIYNFPVNIGLILHSGRFTPTVQVYANLWQTFEAQAFQEDSHEEIFKPHSVNKCICRQSWQCHRYGWFRWYKFCCPDCGSCGE